MEIEIKFGSGTRKLTRRDDIIAVRQDVPTALGMRSAGPPPSVVTEPARGIAPIVRAAFRNAGWHLGTSGSETLAGAARYASRVGELEVRQVLEDENGAPVLDSGRVVVAGQPGATDAQLLAAMAGDGLIPIRRIPVRAAVFEAQLPPNQPTLDRLLTLQALPHYAFVEPSLLEYLGARHSWKDPRYADQWQWNNIGQNGGTKGADIGAEKAWDLTRGTRSDNGQPIRISVIDNGFDVTHPDLLPSWHAGGYFDEDGQGGWAYIQRRVGEAFPNSNHGTFCAGMAAARGGNGQGGCGAAPEAALIPIACLPDQVGTQTTLAMALIAAALPQEIDGSLTAQAAADVISCSLGPNGAVWRKSAVLDLAIGRAVTEGRGGLGAVVVWAVSNGHHDVALDEVSSDPRVIGVGRSTRMDFAHGSAYGEELDLLAPGVEVLSTTSGGGYGLSTGTSYAAPVVAGAAGLVLAQNPTMTAAAVADRLRATCRKVHVAYDAKGHHPHYGHGRLDAAAALL